MFGEVPPPTGQPAGSGVDPHGAPIRSLVGNSLGLAGWTAVSRVSGLLRVVVMAAVLGPTFFGNLYQSTNLLPNIAYEFLTGSLFASLLVPAVVRHIDRGDRAAVERVAGGFLGVAVCAFALLTVAVTVGGPFVIRLLTVGVRDADVVAAQARLGWILLALLMPQVMLYGLIGTAVAVQNAYGRFGFPAAAPLLENLGIVVVLCVYAAIFGVGTEVTAASTAEVAVLGAGTTGAVALHAGAQWFGARAAGATLLPRAGWTDSEVRRIVRLAVPSLGYAGLNAGRLLTFLVTASSVPGGVVAFQLAMNFYNLPVAIGSRPVAQAILPRLARAVAARDEDGYRATLVQGASLTGFIVVPSAVAMMALADPMARAVSQGAMASVAGVTLLTASLAGLAAGVVGESTFIIGTHACYARRDARTPLRVMALRTGLSVSAMATASLLLTGPSLLFTLGLAVSAGDIVAGATLAALVARKLLPGPPHLGSALARAALSSLCMAVPSYLVAAALRAHGGEHGTPPVVVFAFAAATAVATYFAAQLILRSPELRAIGSVIRPVGPGTSK